jgi:hypothetical protein
VAKGLKFATSATCVGQYMWTIFTFLESRDCLLFRFQNIRLFHTKQQFHLNTNGNFKFFLTSK